MAIIIENILSYIYKHVWFSNRENVSVCLYSYFKNIDKCPRFAKNLKFLVYSSENIAKPPFYCLDLDPYYDQSYFLTYVKKYDTDQKVSNILDKVLKEYVELSEKDFYSTCADIYHQKLCIGEVVTGKDVWQYFHGDVNYKQPKTLKVRKG